jgi:hypothetical protein
VKCQHKNIALLLVLTTTNRGSLPPQLLLETLLSVYHVLLPVSKDSKSASFARRLVKKGGFDPNMIIYDGSIRDMPDNFEYMYWGDRLRKLNELVAKPPPGNRFISWIERHTSERNALTVAIIGLFLAVLFGFLGFAVSVAQLVVSILAWKHPVSP